MARNLGALPWPQVHVKFAAEFRDLLANALQFRFGIRVAGEVAQFLDVFFEALDFLLAVGLFRMVLARRGDGFGFVFGAHSGTRRPAGWPQISRTASSNSGVLITRCWA